MSYVEPGSGWPEDPAAPTTPVAEAVRRMQARRVREGDLRVGSADGSSSGGGKRGRQQGETDGHGKSPYRFVRRTAPMRPVRTSCVCVAGATVPVLDGQRSRVPSGRAPSPLEFPAEARCVSVRQLAPSSPSVAGPRQDASSTSLRRSGSTMGSGKGTVNRNFSKCD